MAFDGFKIIQLADLHLGSYGKSYKGISKLVKEVNALLLILLFLLAIWLITLQMKCFHGLKN